MVEAMVEARMLRLLRDGGGGGELGGAILGEHMTTLRWCACVEKSGAGALHMTASYLAHPTTHAGLTVF